TQLTSMEEEMVSRGQWKSEQQYFHKDGHSFFGAVTANPLSNDAGEVTSFNFIIKDISLRKQLEEELKRTNADLEERVAQRTAQIYASEKRFRVLVENNHDIIAMADASFNIMYCSPSALRVIGVARNEVNAQELIEFIHAEDRLPVREMMQHVMDAPGEPISIKCRVQHKTGHYIWLEGTVTNMLADPQLTAIVANFRDVTDQKLAAETLAARETRFRLLIENSTEAIALMDASLKTIYRSPTAARMIGREDAADAMGVTHPDDQHMMQQLAEDVLRHPGTPMSFQGRFMHGAGNFIWLEGTLNNLLHVEGVNAIVANYRDITERKDLEQLLHKANQLAQIGSWEVDLSKKTVYWSPITREIHEVAEDFVPNLATGVYFYKEGYARELISQKINDAIEFGNSWDVELIIITAKNNERWVRCIGETTFQNGTCVRIYGSFQDIDLRKRAEESLKELNAALEERVAQRTVELKKSNEELEAFSYSVSHDLRAPLRAIVGFTSKLEDQYSAQLDAEAKRITAVIKNNTIKMAHLIDDLLSFSRIGRHEITRIPIDSSFLVKEIIEGIKASEAHEVNWKIDPLHSINGDVTTLRQVWTNLISNAVKYSSKTESPVIEIGSYKQEGMIVFFVKDNGIGFNEKYKAKLFRVFQRLHSSAAFEGTGIGLAIVERVVSKHGGKVWAEAAVNKGACFSFSLPETAK
ncbi:MAG TPA: PAS domain S-box protein, partial [Chitinophagaceae bacterium]|nr:PAS domain S-box protein [Chitinophagaceae bacterium]